MLAEFGDFDLVVERFDYRQGQAKAVLTGVEVIGIIKEWCRQKGRGGPTMQQGAQAKHYFTDPRLREAGLWKPGKRYTHAMDALRHLLYYRKDWLVG